MHKVRWGVIGATGIAQKRTIPEGIMPASNSELIAVMDITEEKVNQALAKYGDVQGFTDVGEMLEQTELDVCYIASPPHVHLEHVRACAAAGRHVFCEKPLARTGAEAAEMVEACREQGVKFGIGFMMPYHHIAVEAKRLVAQGALGKVVSARAQLGFDYPPIPGTFRQIKTLSRGGAFMDVGNHGTDLLERIIGAKVATVMARAGNVVHEYEDVEDSCLALCEFDNGAFGVVEAYFSTPAAQSLIEINGSKATLIATGVLGQTPDGSLRVIRTGRARELRIESDGRNMYLGEIEAFAHAILNDTVPPISGEDGLWSQKVLDAVYESAETGQRVEIT